MRRKLLVSAAVLVLAFTMPAMAARDKSGQGGGAHGQGTGSHSPGTGPHGRGTGSGGHQGGGTGGGTGVINPFGGRAVGGSGQHDGRGTGGTRRDHRDSRNPFDIFGPSGHGFRPGAHQGRHNNAFDALRRMFNAPRRFHHGTYRRPHGWYAHRWTFGEFLPGLFFAQQYWISDYYGYGLSDPPPGTVWVRYGDDALLIDQDTGEVIQVIYGIFY